MTWLAETAPGETPLARVFGLAPAGWDAFRSLHADLWTTGAVEARVLDLCRRRVATLLGRDADDGLPGPPPGAGATAAQVAALSRWPTAPCFTDDERACLAFAEQYVLDPHGFSDADVAAMEAGLGAAGVAALVLAIAVFEATARFRAALDT
jgi:alkylhydroperoxidase family enzyme